MMNSESRRAIAASVVAPGCCGSHPPNRRMLSTLPPTVILSARSPKRGSSVTTATPRPAAASACATGPLLASIPTRAREIFGPVAPVVAWKDDSELIDLVNASEMGLAAYVYAGQLQRAMRLGEDIDAGMVGVNRGLVSDPSAPFGGVKQSGLGREGARHGLEEFQETQYLSVDWPV